MKKKKIISTLFFVFTNSMQYTLFKRIANKRFSRNYSRLYYKNNNNNKNEGMRCYSSSSCYSYSSSSHKAGDKGMETSKYIIRLKFHHLKKL